MIHRYEKPTEVKIRDGKPFEFQIDGTWETIQEIIDSWIIETLWWEKTGTVLRYYFSVFTSWYGVYELYLQDGQWILSGDLD